MRLVDLGNYTFESSDVDIVFSTLKPLAESDRDQSTKFTVNQIRVEEAG